MNLSRFVLRLLFGRRRPIISGRLTVPGIAREVIIRRDRFGIPYIEAATEADAWYGLGFCQGQDRAFQLDLLRRTVRGTLSEILGPSGLAVDRASRRIGFRHYAEQQLDVLEPETRQSLQAFAKGAAAGSRWGCRRPAHEFSLLRARPTTFEAVDVLAGLKYVAFVLSAWSAKLARLVVLREDGPEALAALSATYAEWIPVTGPVGALAGPALDRLGEDLALLTNVLGLRAASNNWVLDASRTATGRPLLANDPHLASSVPAPWYLAHVRTPEWAAAGASYVGAPFFASGHNGAAAWGVTAGVADNIDLFLEEVGTDRRSVREGDRFVPCAVRRETIHVKGKPAVQEEVLVTPRGPMISPALEGELGAVSMRATWMEPRPVMGLLQMHHVRSLEQFRRAMEEWPAPSLSVVYADSSGTIAWQLIGDVPRRERAWGTLPLPGWDGACNGPSETIPSREMPFAANPEIGLIASANNKPSRDDAGPYLGMDWADGYRHARIVEALNEHRDWDLPSTQRLQMDQASTPWPEMRQTVLAAPAETAEVKQAQTLLRAWDGIVSVDSPAATVFELFLSEMAHKMARARAPQSFRWVMGKQLNPLIVTSLNGRRVSQIVRYLREQPEGWFQRTWPEELADALAQVVGKLRDRLGPSPDGWAWGSIRSLTLNHPLGSRRPLDRIFNLGPFPWGGDSQTISAAGTRLSDPLANPSAIANLRMIVDVGNWEENLFVLAGGQSGNPLSPHYADQLALWKLGRGVTIAWSKEAIEGVARATLRLLPA